MAADLFDTGIFSIEDTGGAVGSGWKLAFYQAGTTTPQSTYPTEADALAGTNANANPILSDSAGRFGSAWFTTGSIKAVLKDSSDVTKATKDPARVSIKNDLDSTSSGKGAALVKFQSGKTVQDLAASTSGKGAALVAYKRTDAGAVASTLYTKAIQTLDAVEFGVTADGTTDDTAALQAAIAACVNGRELRLPPGTIRYTTALTIPSNVRISGCGRHFGTILAPDGCEVFTIDGSLYGGGWAFRIRIQDLLIDATDASGTNCFDFQSCYNVEVDNVKLYNQPVGVTNGVYVSGVNDVMFRDFVAYGENTSVTRCFNVDGTTIGPINGLKLICPDIESYNRGIYATGDVRMDIVSPYFERDIVCYDHSITAGMVTIFGGIMSSINGYVINVAGDNLLVAGTDLDPYNAGVRGGQGINAVSTLAYRNVMFRNIPRWSQSGFITSTTNHLTLNSDQPAVASLYADRKFYAKKTLTSAAATSFYDIRNFNDIVFCKLRVRGMLGVAYVISEYEWMITASSTASNVTTTAILNQSNANWSITLALTLTPDAGAGKVTVAVTATSGGALGTGQDVTLYTDLEITAYETGVGGIYLL